MLGALLQAQAIELLTRAWDDASTFKRTSRSLAKTGSHPPESLQVLLVHVKQSKSQMRAATCHAVSETLDANSSGSVQRECWQADECHRPKPLSQVLRALE